MSKFHIFATKFFFKIDDEDVYQGFYYLFEFGEII